MVMLVLMAMVMHTPFGILSTTRFNRTPSFHLEFRPRVGFSVEELFDGVKATGLKDGLNNDADAGLRARFVPRGFNVFEVLFACFGITEVDLTSFFPRTDVPGDA